jgi:hypothetical protein
MQLHTHLKSRFAKAALAAAALGGFLFFVGAPGAAARDHDDYRRPAARYDDSRLREAREDHGFYSPQANYWRHERHEALEHGWRDERREAFEHGWRDRYGYWHRY